MGRGSRWEPTGLATSSVNMEYRGVIYTITRETRSPDWRWPWRWRTIVGEPPTMGTGVSPTEWGPEVHVKLVIDWSLRDQGSERASSQKPRLMG